MRNEPGVKRRAKERVRSSSQSLEPLCSWVASGLFRAWVLPATTRCLAGMEGQSVSYSSRSSLQVPFGPLYGADDAPPAATAEFTNGHRLALRRRNREIIKACPQPSERSPSTFRSDLDSAGDQQLAGELYNGRPTMGSRRRCSRPRRRF